MIQRVNKKRVFSPEHREELEARYKRRREIKAIKESPEYKASLKEIEKKLEKKYEPVIVKTVTGKEVMMMKRKPESLDSILMKDVEKEVRAILAPWKEQIKAMDKQ